MTRRKYSPWNDWSGRGKRPRWEPPPILETVQERAERTGAADVVRQACPQPGRRVRGHFEFGVDGVVAGLGPEALPWADWRKKSAGRGTAPTLFCLAANALAPYLVEGYVSSLEGLPWTPFGQCLWDVVRKRFHYPPAMRLSASVVRLFVSAYSDALGDQVCALALTYLLEPCAFVRFEERLGVFASWLTHVDLSGTPIPSRVAVALGRCPELVWLSLEATGVSDAEVRQLCVPTVYQGNGGGLQKLECLLLACTCVTAAILSLLEQLPRLRVVDVSQTAVNVNLLREGPAAFQRQRKWTRAALFGKESSPVGTEAVSGVADAALGRDTIAFEVVFPEFSLGASRKKPLRDEELAEMVERPPTLVLVRQINGGSAPVGAPGPRKALPSAVSLRATPAKASISATLKSVFDIGDLYASDENSHTTAPVGSARKRQHSPSTNPFGLVHPQSSTTRVNPAEKSSSSPARQEGVQRTVLLVNEPAGRPRVAPGKKPFTLSHFFKPT